MPIFRFIGLQEDVILKSLQDAKDGTLLIYPTQRSCREAQKAYQAHWQPLDCRFLSMDDFKQQVIYSDKIRLQDEKRLVCLYQAMTAEDRAVFHIEKYPDLIDWGQHFFQFFDELAEECVDAEDLLQRMHGLAFSYQEWQLENYSRMLALRNQYQAFISAKGFTDAIFDLDITNLHLPSDVSRFVFVNQYYYTRLERELIAEMEKCRTDVVIYYQGSENWLSQATLKSVEFPLEEAFPDKDIPFSLQVYESSNMWQMALAFLDNHQAQSEQIKQNHYIIDAGFLQSPYHKAFSRDIYQWSEPFSLHATKLFHCFQAFSIGLQCIITDNGKKLIRLDWLLQASSLEGFISYFRPDWNTLQKDGFTAFLCKFSEQDVLYLDEELRVVPLVLREETAPECESLLQDIIALLMRFDAIHNIRSLADLIDTTNGIDTDKLLSDQERDCSNLRESFYEGLANFMAMDELALVDDWQSLYPSQKVSSGIFDLFLTFLKPRTYKYSRPDNSEAVAHFTNLMDTRNLSARKVTFLNLVEGELPSSRTPVWLFNENQCQQIGLKNWDDIRNWERYYFFRIIAAAQEVEIYTISNQDKDIEPSSFLNELKHLYKEYHKGEELAVIQALPPAQTLLNNWISGNEETPLSEKVSPHAFNASGWFSLPCERDKDFGLDRKVRLSWTACNHFLKNPFLYYLQDMKQLKDRIVRQEETMGRKMFGILLHHYLNVINRRLAGQHDGILSMQWEWINHDFLAANLASALAHPLFYYQIPRNYNWEYLKALLTPFLIDTASWFFHVGLARNPDFKDRFIRLIPETDASTDEERNYKTLIKSQENQHGISIEIRGRADLRLEIEQQNYIIDFKSGQSDWLQLLFYMWFYYLSDDPEQLSVTHAAFYKLMDKQLLWLDQLTKASPQKLVEKLLESLDRIMAEGFAPASDAANRKYFIDITRADLLRNLSPEEEPE